MKMSEFKGAWALITGASSGIGKEFAIQLAAQGLNIVLVARRSELLESLSAKLKQDAGIKTLIVAIDLTEKESIKKLKSQIEDHGIKIRILINNAGTGQWGKFEKSSVENYRKMINLNTDVVVSMCHAFLPQLESHTNSAVINVSSPATYQPVPYMAVYAATKSFVHNFSQALHGEWKQRGILVQTLVPGPTDTEFDQKAGAYESAVTERGSVDKVVRLSIAGIETGHPVVIAAKGTFMQRLFGAVFPSAMVIREVGKMFKPPAS
jgi:short-subunit dehydrogenase